MVDTTDNNVKAATGCLCGAVRYKISGDPRGIINCHCSKCRRFHGSFDAYIIVDEGYLDFVEKIVFRTANLHTHEPRQPLVIIRIYCLRELSKITLHHDR